jgi:hypothetical protein
MKKLYLFRFLLVVGILASFSRGSSAQTQRNIHETLPSRQVHLDFHTSEFIGGIGDEFDKKQFQEALKLGHVNQINIFSKGHHGWSYYPTEVGNIHPNLKIDLLGAQIEACHEIGVVCPIYYTVGWSANDAENHPEWCARNKDGSLMATGYNAEAKPTEKRPFGSWIMLCPAAGGPYHELIKSQVAEIIEKYPVDGFWFDIYFYTNDGCYCQNCLQRMKAEKVNVDNQDEVVESTTLAYKKHMHELRELIADRNPEATVYFNNTVHVGDNANFRYRTFDMNTHQELEDLPTTWGGYDKLPLEAKYHLGQGTPIVAMSGKFHKAWGEFGGFKHPDAIKYEAAAMISFGASCNFGDQLHPSGIMDVETYRNIGEAYKYVEKIEEFGPGGIPVSNTGLWLSLNKEADHGMVNMLLELHHDFVIADEHNLNRLDLLIVPSETVLSEKQADIINDWVKNGGKLIAFAYGALDQTRQHFLLNVGAEFLKESDYDFDFTVVKEQMATDMVISPFLNYEAGMLVRPTTGNVLASIREPYFNRTYEHYSSHRETPYKLKDSEFPAVVQNGNVIFFAHQLDRLYYNHGVRLHRELVNNALNLLSAAPILKVNNLLSSGRVSMLHQKNNNRYVAHLLYAPALQRGSVKVIEDLPPVPGVEIEVLLPEKITNVYAAPGNKKLDFIKKGNVLKIKVPTFTMHTAIVLEY